jgi:hypothetical protein
MMFTENGTYVVFYDNPDGQSTNGKAAVAEWDWNGDQTAFAYSWDNWRTQATVSVKELTATSVTLGEGGYTYVFALLGVTTKDYSPVVGKPIHASDLLAIPGIIGECDYGDKENSGFFVNGSRVGADSYTPQASDAPLTFKYLCNGATLPIVDGTVSGSIKWETIEVAGGGGDCAAAELYCSADATVMRDYTTGAAFGTTGAVCLAIKGSAAGFGESNFSGRTYKVNGETKISGSIEPIDACFYVDVSAGDMSYAAFYWWFP